VKNCCITAVVPKKDTENVGKRKYKSTTLRNTMNSPGESGGNGRNILKLRDR